MKIICLSDIHACKEHEAEVMTSLGEVKEARRIHGADIVALAGDWWDATVQNTAQGGLDRFLGELQAIANECPVVMVEGTPSHDVDGSLDVIKRLDTEYGITILEPGRPYFLDGHKVREKESMAGAHGSLLILGIPEPRKKYLLANGTAGKDATEEAVRNAMHMLCFQLAAIRKQYADLPCLVVYHGDVAGTTLQNDQTVERGTGIAITIDDLASIGADFYHLGHIHKPQQVGTLPAYYPGSVYAKNFGETHKPGCNLVEIGMKEEFDFFHESQFGSKVTRIDFSHPQNLKVNIDFKLWNAEFHDISGRRVWAEISCKKEEQALVDVDKVLTSLLTAGAVLGSRVTLAVDAVETVRAAEISGTSITPTKKFEIWADQSAIPVTDTLRTKIKDLENASERSGATISGEWELVSVRLRGATGIYKGIRKDEIYVNFDEFDDGIIALGGRNGKGKTTFIENCHAYGQLLTRKGTLKDHFRLKDSFREVIYRDVSTGAEKRFFIQIDGFTKSGGSKYFIFDRAAGETEWIPMPGIDGNLDPYKEAVQAIFGPLELYLRTAFITQRPNKDAPDLTEATKTEKKMLFANLAGIDYLQKFADTAKERADNTAAESHDAEIKIGMLETAVSGKTEINNEIALLQSDKATNEILLKETMEKGSAAKNRVEGLQIAANAERARSQRAADAELSLGRIRQELAEINQSITSLADLSVRRPEIEKEIARYEAIRATIETETEKLREVEKRDQVKTNDYHAQMDNFNAKKRNAEQAINQQKIALQKAQSDADAIAREIRFAESAAPEIEETCPTCKQHLPADTVAELTKKREEALKRIDEMRDTLAGQNAAIASTAARLDELQAEFAGIIYEEPQKPTPEPFDGSMLLNARAQAAAIRIDDLRANLTRAAEASARIEGYKAQIIEKNRQIVEKQGEFDELVRNADPDALTDLELAKTELNELIEKHRQLTADLASSQASLDAQKKRLAEIEVSETELKTLRESVRTAKTEFAEWDLLRRAFGPDGIQALEFDALAPGIAQVANDILTASFGDRFRIEFQTTRMAGTGKNTKQVEDFLIYVIDTLDGEATLLENKSGGEAVWIKRAIYSAFAIIRSRNTGFRFLTSFQDEADGALDSESKVAYCAMLSAEHDTAKLKHTIIITHSEEVKAMIDQKIDMESFVEEKVEDGEAVA